MAHNFITNSGKQKTLKGRINTLISISDQLKFLVGFFYFSGWQALIDKLRENPHIKMKLLIGLEVERLMNQSIVEHAHQDEDLSQEEIFNQFLASLDLAINNDRMDTKTFYEQVGFFIEMIEQERLVIKKTLNPNHAKLYLFELNEKQAELQNCKGQLVTGSSNLTDSGLSNQEEFNVEIKDYGFEDADDYFEELWRKAIPITELDNRKNLLLQFIKHKSQVAEITPFEAYVLILQTYLNLQTQKEIKPKVTELLDKKGFEKYSYQLDAVKQALSILNEYNGCIIADVVGLGKSVIASLVAKNLNKRGLVICPPGLIGDKISKSGWYGYLNDFELYDWEVESRGKLEELAENDKDSGYEIIIVDEAHYFRNQDTTAYEALLNLCRGKQVILLTATPFNNSPADIFALLKLFLVPGKSGITLDDNLKGKFSSYNFRYDRLSFINKNHNAKDEKKREKAEKYYREILGLEPPINIQEVREESSKLAKHIKGIISPVVIRRNRIDLKEDVVYKEEIQGFADVKDPKEMFFYLTSKQAEFYNRILEEYFSEDGKFTGAIYQPFFYEKPQKEDENGEESNRNYLQQKNLYDFMRRLLVKRFESSFGAFSRSIDRFLQVQNLVKNFIDKTGGKYILDRGLIENIIDADEDEIEDTLKKYENDLLKKKVPKNNTVYNVNKFEKKKDFLENIDQDIQLLDKIKKEVKELDLVENDPKRDEIIKHVKSILSKEEKPKRKVILFTEFVATVNHLKNHFEKAFPGKVLICEGKISKKLARQLEENFNAQLKKGQKDEFDILITSDKLAEGFNLNRAGAIINYDIPWNPTKVIQRVGRINRIGIQVFKELKIFNFFPSEKGADFVKSKQIAQQKMFLIHSALGEDSKIFDSEEEPSAAKMYKKVNKNPDESGSANTLTHVRNKMKQVSEDHPEVIEKVNSLPKRVKAAKYFNDYQLNVLRKKGLALFAQQIQSENNSSTLTELTFEELLPLVECDYNEKSLKLSPVFWDHYEKIKNYKPNYKSSTSERSLEKRAFKNLKVYQKKYADPKDDLNSFVNILIKDIRKYHTLSERTLGRLARKEIVEKASKKAVQEFINELKWLKINLGVNYLDEVLKRVEHQRKELIIAVENQKNTFV